jgi:uncharacterized protein (DUF885 family)
LTEIGELGNRYVERMAVLDPVRATVFGTPGHDAEMTDYSPEGSEARVALARETIRELTHGRPADERDRIAADVMRERLQVAIDLHAAGEHFRDLRIIGSPFEEIRHCFDLMATQSSTDWETIASRMEAVPEALSSFLASLRAGAARGLVAARRQALACAEQGLVWSGQRNARPFFPTLIASSPRSLSSSLRRRLEQAAAAATAAYAEGARFLRDEYASRAAEKDAVGRERYGIWAHAFLGMDIDLEETYRWGWEELHRIEARMDEVAAKVQPGASRASVLHLLETDPGRAIEGEETLRQWLQDLMDRTIAELDGKHFDIPEPVKRVEARLAPPGGAAAMYYTRPSEDFKRPGRTWYPTLGKTHFPLWSEVSTAYHEGVPGHHLQLGQVAYLSNALNRFQRVAAAVSGFSEGWALYAERLMAELGYLENPDYELGMLTGQAMRAVRVIVDIGAHLELEIPANQPYHPTEHWSPALMLPFTIEHGYRPAEFSRSEIDRYLGWPGQAISYKVGERVFLQVRESVRVSEGARFDLKAFHAHALNLGPMGLSQFQRELVKAPSVLHQ